MNKKTQARMENIKKAQRLIKPQERGVAAKIEELLIAGESTISIARELNVTPGYINMVRDAMARRLA